MIPTVDQAKVLWEKYHLPEQKRVHVALVARVATFLAKQLEMRNAECAINEDLLTAAALLHDIDKAIQAFPGEQHPDTAVRILREEEMSEVADVVATHPLHAILDARIAPKTWEQKLLYLADKMVKYDIVGVDKRFSLWNEEHLPPDAQKILDDSYPQVKKLEQEVFILAGISINDLPR